MWSTADAAAVRGRIRDAFKSLVVNVAKAVASIEGQVPSPGTIRAASVSMPGHSDIRMNRVVSEEMGILALLGGNISGSSSAATDTVASTEEEAAAEVDRYLCQDSGQLPSLVSYSMNHALEWWGNEGRHKFPTISKAVRALLAVKASAGHMEQDFSLAGFIVSPKRSSLNSAYVDMTLVLKALAEEDVPRFEAVKRMSDDERKSAIPSR